MPSWLSKHLAHESDPPHLRLNKLLPESALQLLSDMTSPHKLRRAASAEMSFPLSIWHLTRTLWIEEEKHEHCCR